jgi:group I intron endonuclease
MEKKPGVYRLQNVITKRFYIGSTKNIYARYYRHRQILREKINDNLKIIEDCEKYGEKSFIFGVVEYCDAKICLEREKFYFDLWQPEYNRFDPLEKRKGFKHSRDSIERMKKAQKKIIWNDERKKNHSEKLKKAWLVRKAKLSPEEFKKKHGDARRGILHSEETKAKMRKTRKGKPKSSEWIEKFRERRKGTKLIDGKYVKVKGD